MTPSRLQELSVLRAVTYAALFDYPLTLRQLRDSLDVVADEDTIVRWWRTSPLLQATVDHRDGLFFPRGRADLAVTRARREAFSRQMLERDRRILSLVSAMPFVRMVALSGSLAHLNAEGVADLDLFMITSARRVWSVTLTILIVGRLLGWRKRLCMNYVISERRMAIEPADLFSANQIIHLRPVMGWTTYLRFLQANPFVSQWYPNFRAVRSPEPGAPPSRPEAASARPRRSSPDQLRAKAGRSPKPLLERVLSLGIAQAAERAARALYGWHLRRRSATWRSIDQVRLEPECLKLHTSSHRADTLARFEAAMTAALEMSATKNTKNHEDQISKVLAS